MRGHNAKSRTISTPHKHHICSLRNYLTELLPFYSARLCAIIGSVRLGGVSGVSDGQYAQGGWNLRNQLTTIGLACALLLATSAVAMASPSFRGYTGLVTIPTADTLDVGEFNLGVMVEDLGDADVHDAFGNYGLIDSMEVGINSVRPVGDGERETLINAKYRLLRETEERAGVAFGVADLTDEIESTAYVVFSKSLARGVNLFDNEITNLRGHFGFGGGWLDGLFLGVSAFVGNRVMASVEWDSEDTHIGLRFTPLPGWRLHTALFDVGGANDLGAGISFQKSY